MCLCQVPVSIQGKMCGVGRFSRLWANPQRIISFPNLHVLGGGFSIIYISQNYTIFKNYKVLNIYKSHAELVIKELHIWFSIMLTWFIRNWWASYGVNKGNVKSISIKVEWEGICCISGFVSWRIYIGVGLSEINWYDMLLAAHLPKRDLSNYFEWNIQREMSLRLPLAWITVLFHLQFSLIL